METPITFMLRSQSSGHILEVRVRSEAIKSFALSDDDLKEIRIKHRDRVGKVAEELHKLAESNGDDLRINPINRVIDPLQDLAKFSEYFLSTVFDAKSRTRLLNELRALRHERANCLLALDEPLAAIDYRAEVNRFVPIEHLFFLPQGELRSKRPLIMSDVITWLSGFLGFAFNVRRIPGISEIPGAQGLVNICSQSDHRIGIRLYPLDRLTYVPQECAFLAERNAHAFQTEVCSFEADPRDTVASIAQGLGCFAGPPVHHFACHFNAGSNSSIELGWHLSNNQATHEIMIDDLVSTELVEERAEYWFAFVNACESGITTTLDLGGLVRHLFQKYGVTCFIGPEHKVRDRLALEFSRVLYANWLLHRDISIAVFKTRWFLAKKYNNPTGLFYAFFSKKYLRLPGIRQCAFL